MPDVIQAALSITFTEFNLPEPMSPMFAFIFDPTSVTLSNHPADSIYLFNITFQSNVTGAALTGGSITKDGEKPPGDISFAAGAEPGQYTITFTNTGITSETRATYNYHVEVTTPGPNGGVFTSDDPEIVLGPPG
jgi:hypothetical protein